MPIRLCRVDDRLIHGQVVVGWGGQLGVELIIVVDDVLAASQWEQDIYAAGLPEEIEARFVGVDEGAAEFGEWKKDDACVFVLTRDVETMLRLAERGVLDGIEVNLGGLHDAPGRQPVLPYLFLGEPERRALAGLKSRGVTVIARDVPVAHKVDLDDLLGSEA